ncbi:hypothetical protein KRR38_30990 [Novosphingobium sp. G106]|uniref:hypothetical protein n=1 Tax=Novosphingobium sp. G106 TaxID=2849500 RepID=UPI001C2D3F18|nr:hypothetical protein [Novosphingobium sp. G106]MBV1691974.1 hypothetical protein [Novosphingobium sp. G106]
MLDELLIRASEVATKILAAPGSAARLRQLGPDDMSEIQRLETSPLATDQLIAVALRLAGSRTMRGNIADHLSTYFENQSSSIEIEAERRSIWQMNRVEALPRDEADKATRAIVALISSQQRDILEELPRWTSLYADLWCDPRIGASGQARRTMLMMVTSMHELCSADGGAALANQARM